MKNFSGKDILLAIFVYFPFGACILNACHIRIDIAVFISFFSCVAFLFVKYKDSCINNSNIINNQSSNNSSVQNQVGGGFMKNISVGDIVFGIFCYGAIAGVLDIIVNEGFWDAPILGFVFVLSVAFVLILVYSFRVANKMIVKNNDVKEAFSNIDVCLKKRWNLINNLVDIVKGYTSHEEDTFKKVTELRNISYNTMSSEEKIKTNEQMSNAIYRIMAVCESYPNLKASDNFKELTQQLSKIEDDIANATRNYNAIVKEFNNFVETFPRNFFARWFGFTPKIMFGATEAEKSEIKVDFKK